MIYVSTVSFLLGVVFEKYFSFGLYGAALAALLCITSSVLLYRSGETFKSKRIIFISIFFIIGVLRVFLSDNTQDSVLQAHVGQTFKFQGVIVSEPDQRDTSVRYTMEPSLPQSKSLVLLIANPFPRFKYLDRIEVEGKLALPKNFESENGVEFDYVNYLGKENIRYEIFRPKITFIESQRSLKGSLFDLKNKFIDSIGKFVPDPDSSLIAGVLFGSKQSLGDVLLDRFKQAGIIHIVVLSGYNITIVASAFLYAANYFGKKRQGLFGAMIAILLFGLMVGLGATVLRAMLMSLLAILARYLGRPFDALRALFIAAFVMIFWNPDLLLYDPSFQLSFMATFGLITLTPFFYTRLGLITPKYGLRETVASTLAVQIFLLPLLIYMSGFISLVSFIVNILVPPLVPVVMLGGFITGLLGLLPSHFGLIAWPFALVTFICARAMILLAEFASSLPFATVSLSKFPLWLVFVFYVVGFALYLNINKKDKPALP